MTLQGLIEVASKEWHDVYWSTGEPLEDWIPEVFNYWEPDQDPWTDLNMEGIGTTVSKEELAKFTRDKMRVLGSKQRQLTYQGLAIGISMQLWKRDRQGLINRAIRGLRMASYHGRRYAAAEIFDNAFSTGSPGFVSGEALCGTHASSATNKLDTGGLFGVNFMTAAYDYFNSEVDGRSLPIGLTPTTLILPGSGSYRRIAAEILGTAKVPYAPDNTVNALLGESFKVYLDRYMSSATAAFMLSQPMPKGEDGQGSAGDGVMGHDLNFAHGPVAQMSEWVDPDAQCVTVATYDEWLVYFQRPEGVFGTPGDGS